MDRPFPPLGKGKNIFVGHLTDIFSSLVPEEWINVIFHHCRQYDNKYIFQTKDPGNIFKFFSLPPNSMVGTTIETNRFDLTKAYSKAPDPALRAMALHYIPPPKFLTIEPILDFDVDEMLKLIETAEPSFINIGADSKGHGLIEPPADKIIRLIGFITMMGIEIREKSNLDRLIKVNNNA